MDNIIINITFILTMLILFVAWLIMLISYYRRNCKSKTNNIPKAKCKECKHCALIYNGAWVYCSYINGGNAPKYCVHFEQRGKK